MLLGMPRLLHYQTWPVPAAGLTASFIAATTSETSATVTFPADINAGDLLVYFDICGAGLTPGDVIPTGFTGVYTATETLTTEFRYRLSYKIADGTETGESTGMDEIAMFSGKFMLQFRGDTIFASAAFSTPTFEGTAGTPAQQTISMSGQSVPIIGFGFWSGGTGVSIDPRTMSASDGEANEGTSSYVKYKIYNAAPADVTLDMEDEAISNILSGVYAIPAE